MTSLCSWFARNDAPEETLMRTAAFILAALLTAASPAAARDDAGADDVKPFVGSWVGRAPQTQLLTLNVHADSSYTWELRSENYAAQSIAVKAIKKDGDVFVIVQPVREQEPLRLEVAADGKSLKLKGEKGLEVVLGKK
jgi:hypothetical protein